MGQRNKHTSLSKFIDISILSKVTLNNNDIANCNIGGIISSATIGTQRDFVSGFINEIERNIFMLAAIFCNNTGNNTGCVNLLYTDISINGSMGIGYSIRIGFCSSMFNIENRISS